MHSTPSSRRVSLRYLVPVVAVLVAGCDRVDRTQGQVPGVALAPAQLDFGTPLAGATVTRVLEVTSQGRVGLKVTRFSIESRGGEGVFSAEPAPGALDWVLTNGETRRITVTFAARGVAATTGMLCLSTNDPLKPEPCIPLSARVEGEAKLCGCVLDGAGGGELRDCEPSTQVLRFSGLSLGATATKVVALRNCGTGNQPLTLDSKHDVRVTAFRDVLDVASFSTGALSTAQVFPVTLSPAGLGEDRQVVPAKLVYAKVTFTANTVAAIDDAALCIDTRDGTGPKSACMPIRVDAISCPAGTVDLDKNPTNGCECSIGAEACDGLDNDCNGLTDDIDEDQDGSSACGPVASRDCNDQSPNVHPGAPEACNGLDDNCSGAVDEGLTQRTFYQDGDGDSYGGTTALLACAAPLGFVVTGGDCNDAVLAIRPGAVEVCNGVDDDCDNAVDEGLESAWFLDNDTDGFGGAVVAQACTAPTGYVAASGDCNDFDQAVFPRATEVCNGVDDNCAGGIDEGFPRRPYYLDQDGDGVGGNTAIQDCRAPTRYVTSTGDCNDFNPTVKPGATETCNEVDDDCDGAIDDGVPRLTWFLDGDGDGFAPAGASTRTACGASTGWVLARDFNGDGSTDWDCDGSDATVYPGANEVCGDGRDNSCSGKPDRVCFEPCSGAWPYVLRGASSVARVVSVVDLDGDGHQEVLVNGNNGFAIVDDTGVPLHEEVANPATGGFSRGAAVVADVDDYDRFGPGVQSLEVLTGNAHTARVFKKRPFPDAGITVISSSLPSLDLSEFLVADLDGDGPVEFFTGGLVGDAGTRIFRYNRGTSSISLAATLPDPLNQLEWSAGRALTDLDGDGRLEFVYGNGWVLASTPSYWAGRLYALRLNPSTLNATPYCTGNCFNTSVAGLYEGAMTRVFARDGELRVQGTYFKTNYTIAPDGGTNDSTVRYWRYSNLGAALDGGATTTNTLWQATTDVNSDAIPEDLGEVATLGLYDVNGDGFPDRVYSSGTQLRLALWNNVTRSYVEQIGSRLNISSASVGVHAAWDLDGDGKLNVLTTDGSPNVSCHTLGSDTWRRYASVPPHFTRYLRTNQWDNYEPNEGRDDNADGLPDHFIRAASALTARGDFYGYLSSTTDKDYFLVDTGWHSTICLTAPPGMAYALKVYSFADKVNNSTGCWEQIPALMGSSGRTSPPRAPSVTGEQCDPRPNSRVQVHRWHRTTQRRRGQPLLAVLAHHSKRRNRTCAAVKPRPTRADRGLRQLVRSGESAQ
jgi:hypothetical protein